MRLISLMIAFLLFPALAWADDGIGTLFTKVNAYTYPEGPLKGRRVLVRSRNALSVINLLSEPSERQWFQVIVPGEFQKISGEGWTPLSPAETLTPVGDGVPVYSSTFERKTDSKAMLTVPAGDLELLNITQNSKRFPQIIWQKVRYSTSKPMTAWIRANAGIYRPGRSSDFISQVYEEMVSRNVEKEKLFRILGGVVRVGDGAHEVQWALGKPLRVQEETAGDSSRVIWHFPSMAVKIRNDVVEQIN